MDLFLIRHGDCASDDPLLQEDPCLSSLGEEQARLVARRVRELGASRLITSDLRRCAATARAISEETALDPLVLSVFREISFGALCGMTQAQARDRFKGAYRPGTEPFSDFALSGGESAQAFDARVSLAFEQHIVEHFSGTSSRVLLVTHAVPINVILHRVLAIPFDGHLRFDVSAASISHVRQGEQCFHLRTLNDCGHLVGIQT